MKALIAMSGGVDSSVAALIMQQKGYECIGCTMKLHDEGNDEVIREHSCCSLSDVEDARAVAHRLGMKYYVFNFKDEFKEKVIDKFIGCYMCGMTPNPCIDCNDYMKFSKLYERAQIMNCECVVTGHYARIEKRGEEYCLLEGPDPMKDQSYVLYRMTQSQLSHTQFPLGDMTKEETRRLAEENCFINAAKKDSQDICFVPDGDYAAVIEKFIGKTLPPGDFVDTEGNILGQHKGIIHYTVGQRKGLGIAAKYPLYVIRIDTENNQVILGKNEELFESHLVAGQVNWMCMDKPEKPFKALVRTRYHGKKTEGLVTPKGDTFEVDFDEPVRAVTPGQAAVIYDGDRVLGGGVIMK